MALLSCGVGTALFCRVVSWQVSATQKRMDRQKQEADRLATNWYDRAQLALQNGDENLAREALARRQQQVGGGLESFASWGDISWVVCDIGDQQLPVDQGCLGGDSLSRAGEREGYPTQLCPGVRETSSATTPTTAPRVAFVRVCFGSSTRPRAWTSR